MRAVSILLSRLEIEYPSNRQKIINALKNIKRNVDVDDFQEEVTDIIGIFFEGVLGSEIGNREFNSMINYIHALRELVSSEDEDRNVIIEGLKEGLKGKFNDPDITDPIIDEINIILGIHNQVPEDTVANESL